MFASKCAGCDQRNANIYNADTDDMYCYDCHLEKQQEDECFCDEDSGIVCHLHEDDWFQNEVSWEDYYMEGTGQ